VSSRTAVAAAARKASDQREASLQQAVATANQARQNSLRQVAVQRATVVARQAAAQISRAQVYQAVLNLSYCTIYAPLNGIIGNKSVENRLSGLPAEGIMSDGRLYPGCEALAEIVGKNLEGAARSSLKPPKRCSKCSTCGVRMKPAAFRPGGLWTFYCPHDPRDTHPVADVQCIKRNKRLPWNPSRLLPLAFSGPPDGSNSAGISRNN